LPSARAANAGTAVGVVLDGQALSDGTVATTSWSVVLSSCAFELLLERGAILGLEEVRRVHDAAG
jgi:hypothetical protein